MVTHVKVTNLYGNPDNKATYLYGHPSIKSPIYMVTPLCGHACIWSLILLRSCMNMVTNSLEVMHVYGHPS
jgi:hypothetical protein